MAVTKVPESASFSIEVRKGTDSSGNPTYTKKSFSNIDPQADLEKVQNVIDAIKAVLEAETKNCYITVSDMLIKA